MKNKYFSRNRFNGEFYLDNGSRFGKDRVYINSQDEKDVFNEIKKYLDKKRKTTFYILGEVPDELVKKLNDFTKNTKIKLEKLKNES